MKAPSQVDQWRTHPPHQAQVVRGPSSAGRHLLGSSLYPDKDSRIKDLSVRKYEGKYRSARSSPCLEPQKLTRKPHPGYKAQHIKRLLLLWSIGRFAGR
jgi:hypothetical protein